jgi:predicted Zn-dependent protease
MGVRCLIQTGYQPEALQDVMNDLAAVAER